MSTIALSIFILPNGSVSTYHNLMRRPLMSGEICTVVKRLENAREVFDHYGGAVENYYVAETGQVCAYGALGAAMDEKNYVKRFSRGELDFSNIVRSDPTSAFLEAAAHILFEQDVVHVNDLIGRGAILAVYDYAIKLAWQALEGRTT